MDMELARIGMEDLLRPQIEGVPDASLRTALLEALDAERAALGAIDRFFRRLAEQPPSEDFLACYFNSWRETHLKMLAIYGLSCRLQRLAEEQGGAPGRALLEAAACNAKTSHEDLGLDYDGVTHAALYEDFAASFLPDDGWTLSRHRLPEARAFGRWVYRNMVVEPVEVGLLTNLLSEVYNHAEYTLAHRAFSEVIDSHYAFDEATRARALTYISAHLEDDTELDHFHCVLEALDHYARGTGVRPAKAQAVEVFRTYFRSLGQVMSLLQRRLEGAQA